MTVDITQDEMNILNLNGLSIEDVKSDIDYMRSTGLDDNTIRQQYTDTINELRPITKQSVNDTRNIKTWNEKGGIGPFEYASKKAMLYNGTYDNIDNNANFNAVENALNNSSRNSTVDERLQERQNKIDARNQRVNEGTASFFDRAGAAIDRIGNSSFQNQVNAPDDFSVKMSGVNKTSNIDKSKKIGFKESLGNSFIGGEWIPYIGGYVSGSGDKKEREIQQHILNGEPIREDELNYLNHRIQERQEEAVRGYTFGGKVADGFLPSMIRYSLEVATGTWFLKSLVLMPELGAGAGVGEQALYHLGNIAKGGTANALLPTGWNDTYENYQQRLLENGMEFTDKGETIFKDANEKPAISFLKSLGSTFAAFASEYSGGLIGMPIKGIGAAGEKYIASPMFKYLKAQPKVAKFIDDVLPELSKAYEKFNFLKPEGKNYEFLKDMTRFDGFLEEMGEEAVEDVLNLTLGTGDDKRTIENYAKAIFKTPDEWAVIAGAIALQGGTLSVASHTLGNYMKQNGATDDEIIDVMKNLSENDKEKAVEDLIKNGEINLDTTSEQRIEQSIDNLTTTLLDTGKYSNRDQAEKVARLGVNMLGSIADKTGIDIEDLINEDMPNIEQDNRETFIDDKGVVHSGITYNEQEQTIDNRYNELINEISNLPDDYSDEEHINKMVSEVDLLEKIQSGENLSIDDMELANDLIEDYENNGNKQFANQLREKLDNANTDFENTVATQRSVNREQHFQSAMKKSQFSSFADFYNDVLENKQTKDKKQFNYLSNEGLNLRIPHDTINHEQKKHKLTAKEWNSLLENIDNIAKADISKRKSSYDGKSVLLKVKTDDNVYGVVLETFKKNNPLISTAFIDTEKNIDNWIKNEGVSSGTKTSFLNITLNNIITDVQPNFKSKTINNSNIDNSVADQHFQRAITAGATTKDEKLNAIKEWKEKGTDSKYFKRWFGDSKVVDESGKPLVVYHGSLWKFDTFGKSDEFDFSFSPKFAYEYAAQKSFEQALDLSPVLYSVYLKAENPFDFRDEKSVNELLKKIGDKEINFWGDKYSHEQFKDLIMGLSYENTVKNQEVFDKAEVGMAYSRYNEDVEEKMSSVADAKIVYKNKDYFVALDEIDEPRRSPFSSEPAGRVDRDDVYKQVEKLAKDIDFADEYIKKITLNTNLVKTTYEVGKGYVNEYTPYELTVRLRKVDNPKIAKKGTGYDNWSFFEATKIGDTYFLDFLKENGYDSYYKQEKEQLNISVFNSEQIKSVNNKGTFDESNPNIYFQRATNNNNNVVDLTNDFEKAPSIDEVKAYINEIVENGTKFATLSPNWFVDIKGGAKKKAHIIKSSDFSKMNKSQKNRHNKYIMSLEKLLANAEYAGEKENTKKDKKPNVEKYHYFKTDVKIGNKIYQLIFDTEEYKNDNKKSTSVGYAIRNLNETEADTNIINDNVKKFNGDTENSKSSLSANVLRSVKNLNEDTNSINDNAENINPKTVHLYNIKEIKNPQLYQKQHKMFIDNDRVEEISNRLVQVKGSFIPAENLVKLFKDADESTIVHEFAHWWLEKLVKHSEGNEELQEDLKEIRKFVKNNGEEFTDEQHERFARGFEVYIRTGSAKTNRLKKLFEDFKNALLSLYDSIKSLGFEDTEISEINNLFDRLLTTEKQRIQAAVFDRCNTIQSQIEEIRTNQENELSEIDEIEKNNLERSLQDNRKKQQVEEYLRLADKVSSRVPKSVKEYSKRFRQVCYEILSAALNHKYSIKYLQMTLAQNNAKAENLRQELMEVDDDITTLGGMQSNWYEFFGDTGVNYNNDEVDGDAKLVEQALDRIENNNFAPPESYPGEEIIGKFMGAFDYLSGKVLSLRGENKDAAFEALSELFSGRKFGNLISLNQLPQDVMTEISNRMDEISKTYIEQKTNEKNKYAIPNVSLSTQLRTYVTHKLHNTKSYDPIEKKYIRLSSVNRLFSLLPLVNNSLTAKEVVRTINAHAIKQLENRQKYILHKEIQKQIKINSKLIKVGALKQGKFDWKTNTVFSELQQMNHLTKEDARKEYLRLIDADAAVIGEERDNINQDATNDIKAPTDFQGILKVKFLEYKSNNAKDLNLSATRSLLEDILQLKFEGRRAKNEQDLKKALTRYDYKNNLIEIMDKHRDNNIAKYLARWTAGDTIFTSEGTLANWESLLTGIFDKTTAEKYSLLKSEADVEVYAHRKSLEFYKKAMDIYHLNRSTDGLKNKIRNVWDRALDFDNIQPLVDLFRKYDETTYPFKQATWNKDTGEFVETTIELNHSQLITLYAWSLNPNLKERLITQFVGEDVPNGAEKLNELMFAKLSEQDKLFAWAMVDTCETMYEDTNEVFIRTTGLSLPRVDNYIPSKTERIGSDLDMMHETMLRSTNPSFIKQRKNCSRIKMVPISPLEIILPHINKTARYVVMSEKVNFYNRIFQSPDIKAKIIEIYGKKSGEKIHRILLNQLATSTYDNYAKSITVGKNLIDTVASNYITSKIGGNLKVMFSQLTSMVNYCENMPFGMWSKGFADALAHPKKTVDFMFKNCEYLQARLAGNSQNEIISMVTNNSDKFRALRNFCTSNTKYGDIIAIMFGGKPYVDYLISKGMSQEEAFTKFTEDTLRSQQSGHSSATSAWQKKQAQNAITRMIFAFNNTNFQYERKFVDAMANLAKGGISKEEFIKSFLIYKVFNPILFTSFLSDLSLLILLQNMFGGGDDDPLASFGSDIINAILLSNWKAYGFLGIIANSIVSAISAKVTGGMYFEEKLPLISDFETSINKLLKGKKLELGDYIEMIAGAGDYSTGVATTRLYNATEGLGDITQGDIGTGLLRIIGYGKYRASLGATGKPPEKKKK